MPKISKRLFIPSSEYQTKNWRNKEKWYFNGKHNECENYQVEILEKILEKNLTKTYERINMESLDIEVSRNPLKYENGYEFTENFDRKMKYKNNIFYYNLKFICDYGGAQTRSLREVYHFLKCQLDFLKKKYENNKTNNIYFVNILDGDCCFFEKQKFFYLLNKKEYEMIKKFIFCDDMNVFKKWIEKIE